MLSDDDYVVLASDRTEGKEKKKVGNKEKEAPQQKTVVLNLLGDFVNPWKATPDKEKALIATKQKWHPGSDSWVEVYGATTTTKINSLSSFLGVIQNQKTHSIERINLFSHGNFGLIAFSGTIVESDVMLRTDTALDLRIADTDPIPLESNKVQDSFGTMARKLQNRFTDNAEMWLFLCNSGTDEELLQDIANAFHVTARGFSHQVWVCAEWLLVAGSNIDRGFTSLDRCETKRRGFAHLRPDRSRRPK
jgi:hypothetical protein